MRRLIPLFICCLLLLPGSSLRAQMLNNPVPASYNSDMQRFLVLSSGNFLYGVSQGQIDKDSAMLFAAAVYQLSRLTPYNEGYKTGRDYAGQALIDSGKITAAVQLLDHLQGSQKLQLLAELSNYYLHRPGAAKDDMTAAGKYASRLHRESNITNTFWQLQSYWLLAGIAVQEMNIDKSQAYYTQAAELCRSHKDPFLLCSSLILQADALPVHHPQKEHLLNEALALSHKHQLLIPEYRILLLSSLEHLQHNPDIAEKEVLRALAIEEQIGYLHHQYCYYVLSYITLIKADAVATLQHNERVLNYMAATRDTAFAPLYYLRIATIRNDMDNYKEALYWNDRALNVSLSKETQIVWYKAAVNKLATLAAMGRPADGLRFIDSFSRTHPPVSDMDKMILSSEMAITYELLGNDELAFKYYLRYLEQAKRFPPQFSYSETLLAYVMLGNFYFKKGNYALARKYANLIFSHPHGKTAPTNLGFAHKLLFKVDSATGNYPAAIAHLIEAQAYADSTFSHNQQQALDELSIKYETQKKDQDIRLLKQDSQLQKEQLSRSAMTARITLGGIALLLIIVGLLYNQYRIKRKASLDAIARSTILQQLVEEKEWLLREVHHRVKNNLQTIVSLLESQSTYLQNDALLAIQESQNRIHAMSLIHQKLYHDENVSSVSMNTYLPELIQYLRQSYNVKNDVSFQVQVDAVALDVSQAIPLGLIVNEAVTNAIKYAFPQPGAGHAISILFAANGDHAQLRIADNGIGIKPEKLREKIRGLGLKLIRGLAKDMDAAPEISGEHGTAITISFAITRPLNSTNVESAVANSV
ncbi:sensor histidine kinase [Chitinophaga agri]|uniref:histidine kinase n=1 Tax=Chitinophaga agri TaxID=2703787 RepID=A0A6B9ZDM4_9BACT|nr:sensor histidine kinase [Chitinophaga agri]QHS59245.1 hypothetical protein GWR21_06500 [Chitinophaga agri]